MLLCIIDEINRKDIREDDIIQIQRLETSFSSGFSDISKRDKNSKFVSKIFVDL